MSSPSIRTVIKNQAQLSKNFRNMGPIIYSVIKQIIDNNFIIAENYAKSNAPWTDRTGDARRSISSVDDSNSNTIRYYITIGVDYGIWLEIANQGKYRILVPTSTILEADIIRDLKKIGVTVKMTGSESFKT